MHAKHTAHACSCILTSIETGEALGSTCACQGNIVLDLRVLSRIGTELTTRCNYDLACGAPGFMAQLQC